MALFDDIWRESATPMLEEHFGESDKAMYYDGGGNERGRYDVLLGPESATEDKAGEKVRFQRTATFSWEPDSEIWKVNAGSTGRVVVVDGGGNVEYSIAGVLCRSESSLVLLLRRGAASRQWNR